MANTCQAHVIKKNTFKTMRLNFICEKEESCDQI